jgi:DNA-binding PadR family transcriptional regulator
MTDQDRKLTDAELAILSLLAEQPMHGYQIEQVIEARGMREWVEMGFSSIYYLLGKLKRSGLLESRMERAEGKGPAKQVFALTKSGRGAWRAGALNAITHPSRAFSNFQLGLSNIRALEPTQVLSALTEYQHDLADNRDRIMSRLASYGPDVPFEAAILFDLSLRQITCEHEWVAGLIEKYSSEDHRNMSC